MKDVSTVQPVAIYRQIENEDWRADVMAAKDENSVDIMPTVSDALKVHLLLSGFPGIKNYQQPG